MKKIITSLVILVTLIIGVFIFLSLNKTFLKNEYLINGKPAFVPKYSYFIKDVDNKAIFYTIEKVKDTQDKLNQYVENLPTCYDEGYFYDKEANISIMRYTIEDVGMYNKIELLYKDGNYCETEFVLDDNWYLDIKESNITEAVISKCETEFICDAKKVLSTDIMLFLEQIDKDKRVDETKNIYNDITDNEYVVDVYYKGVQLSIFIYEDKYLNFKIIDVNDHPKNALYELDNAYQLLENLYK